MKTEQHPLGERLRLRLSEDEIQHVQTYAAANDISFNQAVKEMLRQSPPSQSKEKNSA